MGKLGKRILSFLAASAFLILCGCAEDKVAGGYDDVENPAIKVSMLDSLGRPGAAGEIRAYARYQNPLKDAVPLFDRSVAQGGSAGFGDTLLLAAMAEAKARGTHWSSRDTVEFNLVGSAPGGEAFLGDFLMVRSGPAQAYRFLRRSGGSFLYPDAKGVLAAYPALAPPVLAQRGRVGERGLQLGLKSVFIAGSPYRAEIGSDGSFTLPRLAAGRYEVKAVDGEAKVYSAADSLATGTEYAPSDWSEADIIWIE